MRALICAWTSCALLAMGLGGCGGGSGSSAAPPPPPTYQATSGVALKGPLILGSSVTAQELDASLAPTGKQYTYQVTSDLGDFSPNSSFSSPYIGLMASGYYFDEVANGVSGGPITLNGVADLSAQSVLDVNLLTTLAYQRIQGLVAQSHLTVAAASAQAESEVLAAFHIPSGIVGDFGTLDLGQQGDGAHVLAAVSSVFVNGRAAGDLATLIAAVQHDIGANGAITDPDTQAALDASARTLDPVAVAANLTQKYTALGITFAPADISDWIDQDGDGLVGRFKFSVSHATSTSSVTFPLSMTDPYAGTTLSATGGRLYVNGTFVAGAIVTKAGDSIAVSPPAEFVDGVQATYLLSGSLRIGRASFLGADRWSSKAGMSRARGQETATALLDGRILVAGGWQPTATAEIYDPALDAWTAAATMPTARYQHTATRLADGRVLVTGGYDVDGKLLASAELYDPVANAWTPAGSMAVARALHVATLLPDGRVLIVGDAFTTEIYDPVSNGWSTAAPMSDVLTGFTATLLANGTVLVAGGETGQDETSSTELYDPLTDAWLPAGPLAQGRASHAAAVLEDGRVVVAGGSSLSLLASAEVFDPDTLSWTTLASMATARELHTLTPVHGGRLLAAGGFVLAGNGTDTATAELYDPATGAWSAAPDMLNARRQHAAIPMPDGSVLVMGGINQATVESFW
jgi:N-acetylneuraminic acid mutarotase